MKLQFFKPKDYEGIIKATIHTSGKLGFTDAAIKKIGISDKMGIKLACNENDKEEKNLYALFSETIDEETFKINKAGAYYYVNTKGLFDNMQVPYKTKRISYDIIPSEIDGEKIYTFLYRERKKKDI